MCGVQVHIPESMYGVQVHIHTHHRLHREHRPLVQPQHHVFHTHKYHSQDHIHCHSQEKSTRDGHNHVPENKCCVQDHILHMNHREHRPQPLAQPQHHAFHIHKCRNQDHIHGHSQEKSSRDGHNHVPKNKHGVQDRILHKNHKEHQHQLLAQHQPRVFHIHKYHSQDHIHGHSQEKSSRDGHSHVLQNKCGVQDHILHKYHREHQHQPLVQPQPHVIHGHSQEKSNQDALHHTQDDQHSHSHTEGQHQQ